MDHHNQTQSAGIYFSGNSENFVLVKIKNRPVVIFWFYISLNSPFKGLTEQGGLEIPPNLTG
ncbi:hypothetical protein [Aeromonas media]|uniref:hypothetical protein n=1 Tax=Aeromonas media TaxID=651 RepID=UPI00384FD158